MNLTFNQKVAFVVAVLSFLSAGGSAADLVTLFGSTVAKSIAAFASIGAGIGGLFLGVVTGQANLVKDVQAMPGIEKIQVNAQANSTLAKIAVDPANDKVEVTPEATQAVEKKAQE